MPLARSCSLWDLLIAPSTQLLQDLMETDLITVQPDTDAQNVAQKIAKYNLFAVPVVNEQGVLEGVVTVDDALDVLLPDDKKAPTNEDVLTSEWWVVWRRVGTA